MKRKKWLVSSLIAVAGALGAGSPGQVGPKSAATIEAKAQTPEGSARTTAQGQPRTPTTSPDPRAQSLFRSAQNLEKAGKKTGAINLYRDLLIRYPESPEAPESAARIGRLGGKVPAPAEIRPAPPAETASFTRPPKPKYASQEANRAALNQALGGIIGGAASPPTPNGNYQGKGPYSP